MKNKLVQIFALFTSLSFFGCNQMKNNLVEFTIPNIVNLPVAYKSDSVKSINLNSLSKNIKGVFTCMAVIDTFLVCGNLNSPKLVNIYSLNSGMLLNDIITRGTNPNEGLSVSSIKISNYGSIPFFWVYDITQAKLFKIEILKAINDSNYKPKIELQLSNNTKNIISPELINDSLMLATSYKTDANRYFYLSPNEIKVAVGKLPELTNNELLVNQTTSKLSNKAKILKAYAIKHKDKNKIAVFYQRTDIVEFYSNDTLVYSLIGKNKINPIMQFTKFETGFSLTDCDKTKYCYTSITSTNEIIYALYAGENTNYSCSNRVFVYDWKGKFKRELILDRNLCFISIDAKSNILYGYDDTDNTIYSIKLINDI